MDITLHRAQQGQGEERGSLPVPTSSISPCLVPQSSVLARGCPVQATMDLGPSRQQQACPFSRTSCHPVAWSGGAFCKH